MASRSGRAMAGPLEGITVVEINGLGPTPFGAMILCDLGADVIRVDRPGGSQAGVLLGADLMARGRRSIVVDLKLPEGPGLILGLVEMADVLLEGYRPGVAERLGIGPEVCLERNPRLIYGRMTGWGREGPLADRAGHDIDYLAVSGALHPIGPPDKPSIPINLISDFGGGGMLLATGVLAALVERGSSGLGQVVDAAMVDGTALLTTLLHGMRAAGMWTDRRGENLLDGGAPFYDVYRTSDGEFMAVGALEPWFYAEFVAGLGIDSPELPAQYDREGWPVLRDRFSRAFAGRTREEWTEVFSGTDACVAPVLSLGEAPDHPHLEARSTFVTVDGVRQPGPAPRFERTPTGPPGSRSGIGDCTDEILTGLGLTADDIAGLRARGVVA